MPRIVWASRPRVGFETIAIDIDRAGIRSSRRGQFTRCSSATWPPWHRCSDRSVHPTSPPPCQVASLHASRDCDRPAHLESNVVLQLSRVQRCRNCCNWLSLCDRVRNRDVWEGTSRTASSV